MHRPAPAARLVLPLKGRLQALGTSGGGSGKGAKITAGVIAALALLLAILLFTPLAHPRDLQVEGATGSRASQIQAAIEASAKDQSTFRMSEDKLMAAVSDYPEVAEIQVAAHPPFRVDLTVVMRPPVGRAQIGGRTFTVAGDGTVLERAGEAAVPKLDQSLGALLLRDGRLVGDGGALRVLGSAPEQLLDLVRVVRRGDAGLEIELQRGPRLIFGNAESAVSKWAAATAVIADGAATRATYIDVRVPGRPAVGGIGGSKNAAAADAPPTLSAGEATPSTVTPASASTSSAGAAQTSSGTATSTANATPETGAASSGAGDSTGAAGAAGATAPQTDTGAATGTGATPQTEQPATQTPSSSDTGGAGIAP